MQTPIGRHYVESISHYFFFVIHDVLLPMSILFPLVQIYVTPSRRHLHKRWGQKFRTSFFPAMVLTGFILTIFTMSYKKHVVPLTSIFFAYGLSYSICGINLLWPQYKTQHYNFIMPFIYIIPFYHLCVGWHDDVYKELFILLFPIPVIHALLGCVHKHSYNGHFFNYLGLLGTAFTISYDHYFFFTTTLSFPYRLCIQNIPFFFLLQQTHSLISFAISEHKQ